MILTGKMICPGVARGTTHVVDGRAVLASAAAIPPEGPPSAEVERLHAAIGLACLELDRLQRRLQGRVQASDVAIFSSHAGLLRDSKFVSAIEEKIRSQLLSAEAAVAQVIMGLYGTFLESRALLLQDKAPDVLDIGRRLLRCLTSAPRSDLEVVESSIIVAGSLTPSELVRFAHQGVSGVITEVCGQKSHTAILARGFGIPLITQVAGACEVIPTGVEVLLDATGARVILYPNDEEQELVDHLVQDLAGRKEETSSLLETAQTADGLKVKLLLNISDPVEAAAVAEWQADGIGLFRTEFVYMDREWWPTPEEGYRIYRDVADAVGEAELTIRLVDFGAEKSPAYAEFPMSRNPSLGLRGIRLLLQREDIFRPQVEALARLGRERPLTVLLPMLDSMDTLEKTIDCLCRYSGVVERSQLPFKIGAMIEVPSAAYMIDEILERTDSVSIGLNDLTQFMLAADRDDEFVEPYHDAMQPSVLRMLSRIIEAAKSCNKDVTICGELAGDPDLTGLLLALGIRQFSVARSNYRGMLGIIRQLSVQDISRMASEVLRLKTGLAVRKYAAQYFGMFHGDGI